MFSHILLRLPTFLPRLESPLYSLTNSPLADTSYLFFFHSLHSLTSYSLFLKLCGILLFYHFLT